MMQVLLQGKIRAMAATMSASGGMTRKLVFEFSESAIMDEIQELMQTGEEVQIEIRPVQLQFGKGAAPQAAGAQR
jgi:hypothetical protein